MRKRDPRPVMVIDEGTCQSIGEAKSNEFDGMQEPLPDAMRVLLCLIDGAERRHRLVRKWQSQAAHDLHVEVEGGDIMVTLPGTSYAVTYYKLAKSPQLHGRHLPDQVDRRSPISQAATFRDVEGRGGRIGTLGEPRICSFVSQTPSASESRFLCRGSPPGGWLFAISWHK